MLMLGSFPLGVLSSVRKYALWALMMGLLVLIGMTPLCLGGILRVDLTVPIVAMHDHKSVCRPEIYHFFVYSNFFSLSHSIR